MRRIIIFALSLLCAAMLLPVGASALSGQDAEFHSVLEGAVEHEGNYYKLINLNLTWEQAQAYCEGMGGHLATLTSAEENDVCEALWLSSGAEYCWLGGTDRHIEGAWEWVTREEWVIRDYSDGEPDGSARYDQDYLAYYIGGQNGYWVDADTMTVPFLCEWETTDVESVRQSHGFIASTDEWLNGAFFFGGHVYKPYPNSMSYDEAAAYCRSLGGHLADITSAEENTALYAYLVGLGMSDGYTLGGTDRVSENYWVWDSQEEFTYKNWNPAEPDGDAAENYAVMFVAGASWIADNYPGNGTWIDHTWTYPFVCEWDEACFADGTVAASHSYGPETVVLEAGCGTSGLSRRTCERCGHTVDREILAISHTFAEWETVLAPTCETAGKQERTCSRCALVEEKPAQALGHSFGGWAITLPPTCLAEGRNECACTRCGLTDVEPVPIRTHDYTDWTVVSGSLLIPPIVREKSCTLCGMAQSETDWGYVWVPIVSVLVLIGTVLGVISYVRAFRKK